MSNSFTSYWFPELLYSVEWKSNFMVLLIAFHIVWLGFTIISVFTRKQRLTFVFFDSLLAYLSERINNHLMHKYKKYGLEVPVFDNSGTVIFFIWAIPFIFSLFLVVISYIRELMDVLALNAQFKLLNKKKTE